MNLIAMIGTINDIAKISDEETSVKLKIEKPFVENIGDDLFDIIDVSFTNIFFKKNLKLFEKGQLIALKGRIKVTEDKFKIVADKVQLFS